jgi:integrase
MTTQLKEKKGVGIALVHARGCTGRSTILAAAEVGSDVVSETSRSCQCGKGKRGSFQATVWSNKDAKLIRQHFRTKREAEVWRGEQRGAAAAGTLRAPSKRTIKQAGDELLAGMRDSTLLSRSGRPYKPSTIRRYELALEKHIYPEIAKLTLSTVDRVRVDALIKKWVRDGQDPSSIRNNLDPLRVIFREALYLGAVVIDPMMKARVPQGSGRRERVADRAEAQALLEALPAEQRAIWACAFWGGLRRGELRGLRWDDVAFEAGVIRVEHGWDDVEGEIETKSLAGTRAIPLAGQLRRVLVEHQLATGRRGSDLVFGRTASDPFTSSTVNYRARRAWGWTQVRNPERGARPAMVWIKAREDALEPIGLHEARHSAASYLIEAGLNDLELTAMIGHSDPRTTKHIYGHLFDDSREKVTAKLDAYLEAAE